MIEVDLDYDDSRAQAEMDMRALADLDAPQVELEDVPTGYTGYDDECMRFPWRIPVAGEDIFGGRFSAPEIIDVDLAAEPSIIALLADDVAKATQFPRNTAYLHALGVFSCATVMNFQVQRYDSIMPTGLYTVGGEGSGAGKSRIHRAFMGPVIDALKSREASLERKHYTTTKKIKDITDSLEKEKNDSVLQEKLHQRRDLMRELENFPPVDAPLKSATPESAIVEAGKQYGLLNISSDEAEAINTMLDLAYKDTKKTPANNGFLTAAFDGDYYTEARVGRGKTSMKVRGAFAVMAQRELIETLIRAGESGRGVSERFLIVKEKGMVGYRDKRANREVRADYVEAYKQLCVNVCQFEMRTGQLIKYGAECAGIIEDIECEIEPLLRPGATYGSEQLRGAASKLTQQALKIAANIHIAQHWSGKRARPNYEMDPATLIKGFSIARQMLESQRQLIDVYSSKSAAKPAIELAALLVGYARNGDKHVKFSRITSSVNKRDWYIRADDKAEFIINMLRRCEALNFCYIKEVGANKSKWVVLVNPMLADFNPLKEEK